MISFFFGKGGKAYLLWFRSVVHYSGEIKVAVQIVYTIRTRK